MSDTVLDPRTKTMDNSLIERTRDDDGTRYILAGGICIASEDDGDWAREARFLAKLHKKGIWNGTIAVLGGGLSILPRLLNKNKWTCTVYEAEPLLQRYAPAWCSWVTGDWHQTLTGTFDVIVLDTGEDVDACAAELAPHLNPNGMILPVPSA